MNLIRILFLWGLSVTSILAEVSLVVSPVEDAPVLRHKPLNPVLSFTLGTSGSARAGTLESV